MTPDRDIDRILDGFLADGAHEMPDRVFDAAFERIERTPQARPARTPWRFPRMLPTVRLGIAAVLALTLGVVVSPMLAPSPAPSPTPRPTPGYLPSELQHHWLAPSRQLPEMGTSQDRAILRIGQSSVTIYSGPEDYDGNGRPIEAGIDADGNLVIRNAVAIDGCEPGSTGTYTPALTENGQHLALTLVSDECAVRGQWMAGDDWIRSQCLNPDNQCLGIVEPGTYPSQFFSPRVPPGPDWTTDLGALTWTAPEGWAGTDDWPSNYGLMPATTYEATWAAQDPDPVWPDSVTVWARPAIVSGDTCSFGHAIGGGVPAKELAAQLAAVPGLDVSEPQLITVGDRSGVMVDTRLADGWTGTCSDITDGRPFVPYLAESVKDGYMVAVGGQPEAAGRDPQRVIFLDIGGGDVVAVVIDSATEDGFDAFVASAMPVIDTIRIRD